MFSVCKVKEGMLDISQLLELVKAAMDNTGHLCFHFHFFQYRYTVVTCG